MADQLIAYLMTATDEARGAYIGAVMVTDGRGLPTEFRHTEPILPTRIQKVLYGQALDPYLRTDVIGSCLLRDLQSQPGAVLVREEVLLALEDQVPCPVLCLFASNQEPLGAVGEWRESDGRSFLMQLSEQGGPTRVRCAREDPGLLSAARDILTAAIDETDVLEPLDRLEEAVSILWTETPTPDSSSD
ncbi:MAG: hypothetical protein GF320_05365 [Armatimonadia bacterium]|nr:hypothetical protein [Armatimonadia bacterium]